MTHLDLFTERQCRGQGLSRGGYPKSRQPEHGYGEQSEVDRRHPALTEFTLDAVAAL